MNNCAVCGGTARFKCSQCQYTAYCGKKCQKQHWKEHKDDCAGMVAQSKERVLSASDSARIYAKMGTLKQDRLVTTKSTIPLAGKGLFTIEDIEAGAMVTLNFLPVTNDAAMPDWLAIFSSCRSMEDLEASEAWQRYVQASQAGANVTYFANETNPDRSYHIQDADFHMPIYASRNIAAGEEIFAHYGLTWFSMKYHHLRRQCLPYRKKYAKEGEVAKDLTYLVEMPQCLICGVMKSGEVMENCSLKHPDELYHLTDIESLQSIKLIFDVVTPEEAVEFCTKYAGPD